MLRKTGTPYKPVLKDPTDTSHFDDQQTGIPVYSPPKNASEINKLYEAELTQSHDEFDEFYFSQPNSF